MSGIKEVSETEPASSEPNHFLNRNFRVADFPWCEARAITEESSIICSVKSKFRVAFPCASVVALAMAGALLGELAAMKTSAPFTALPSCST